MCLDREEDVIGGERTGETLDRAGLGVQYTRARGGGASVKLKADGSAGTCFPLKSVWSCSPHV